MTIKAYFIACVWACYKYILSRENEQVTTSEDTEALLGPPAYSTVIKTPPDVPTPPPYQPWSDDDAAELHKHQQGTIIYMILKQNWTYVWAMYCKETDSYLNIIIGPSVLITTN